MKNFDFQSSYLYLVLLNHARVICIMTLRTAFYVFQKCVIICVVK